MPGPRSAIEWLRHGRDPMAESLRRAGTSAIGTYSVYVGYGLIHAGLRRPYAGPEASEPLPGDELIDAPESDKTFAIDIGVPPDQVWPYLTQMGYGRAGWYGWYPLENGGRGSASGIVPELQSLAIGDVIPDGPHADEGKGVWRVIDLEPPATMVLFSRRALVSGQEIELGQAINEPTIECSWAFIVRPQGAGSRLIVRVRARYLAIDSGVVGSLARRFFDLGDTVMEWTMLDGIKARAERGATMPPM